MGKKGKNKNTTPVTESSPKLEDEKTVVEKKPNEPPKTEVKVDQKVVETKKEEKPPVKVEPVIEKKIEVQPKQEIKSNDSLENDAADNVADSDTLKSKKKRNRKKKSKFLVIFPHFSILIN